MTRDTYKELMVFAGHTDSVLAIAFSPNGKLLVSGGSDQDHAVMGNRHRETQTHPRETRPHLLALLRSPQTVKGFGVGVVKTTQFDLGIPVMAADGVPKRPQGRMLISSQSHVHIRVKL